MVLQFDIGDEVFLINPCTMKHKVATARISGLPSEHKFYFAAIPDGWLKVDVLDIIQPGVALMLPNDDVDMRVIADAKGWPHCGTSSILDMLVDLEHCL